MINWRSIKEVGYPTDSNMKYLVSDGKDISTSNLSITKYVAGKPKFRWYGEDNDKYNQTAAFTEIKIFDMIPTHWCPLEELNLPNIPTFNPMLNWEEDLSSDMIDYKHRCYQCCREFIGHKGRTICKVCSDKQEVNNG